MWSSFQKKNISLDVSLIANQEEMGKVKYNIDRNSLKIYIPGANIPMINVFMIPVAAYNLLDKFGVIKMLK